MAESATPSVSQKPRSWGWLAFPVIFLLGLGSGWLLWGRDGAKSGVDVKVDPNVKRYDVPIDDDPVIGADNAEITIIEFSDYQCPYCSRWYSEVFDRLMQEYDGKIRFVYRDFPLSAIHPDATPAAEAANCAGEQGVYWQFHRALFSGRYGLGSTAYEQYAAELGLDAVAFSECMAERRYADEVAQDFSFASQLGVRSTPTFFINGMAVVGAQPYEVFQQIIDKELAGEIP